VKILLSAGEASGDRLGAGLARALLRRRPDLALVGMGGDEMRTAGVTLLQHASEVAVVGIVEVATHLPRIRGAMRRLAAAIRDEKPDLLVPIDFPDFNLRLAAKARAAGVPVVYYVSPQVWAWRRGRVRAMRRIVRRMLVLFPFERRFYDDEGVPATFVGHPAASARPRARREEVLARARLDGTGPVVALLPGSRVGEAGRVFPTMLEAAARIRRTHPRAAFVAPRARTIPPGFLEGIAAGHAADRVAIRDGLYDDLLDVADAGAVASGTATLDAALAGLPFVACYRMQPISYLIARALVDVPHIALPNLIAGRRIVPELVQGAFTPEAVAAAVASFLDDPDRAASMREQLAGVRAVLEGDGAYDRAADAVLREIDAVPV
jgi:lipid-A-disaccharide synthase